MTYHELVGYIVFPLMALMFAGMLAVMTFEIGLPRFMQRWLDKRQRKKCGQKPEPCPFCGRSPE